ncbi:2-keto-4-pentenoate hydratase [Marinibacterium anthonyi]|nr:2-keto-4-pentenoate hydratase [Marinibacterium anthonyi]
MNTTERFATALIEAHRSGLRADGTALPAPTHAEALAIQSLVQAQLGPVGGFKGARRADGPDVIAPIGAARIRANGADVPVRDRMGIELEVGFEVLAVPDADPLRDPASWVRPCVLLELVDMRLDGVSEDPMKKLADGIFNDGLVIGAKMEGWTGADFTTVTASLTCGDRQVIDGARQIPGGSALATLDMLWTLARSHCGGLREGQFLITGSLSGLEYFPAGTQVAGRIEGLGDVACSLV